MDWSTSCPDWERRIVERQSLIASAPLFPAQADDGLEVFKSLCIVDAPGRPTFGEAGEQWVFDFVAAIFGAYDPERGERLINEFFLCVSKKNGKSTIAAGIMLTALILNWRQSNELIIVAPTIKAANNSFKPAADMVRADPELNALEDGHLQVIDHQRMIKHLTTGATLQILAADAGTVAGNKSAFVLIDELWEFGSRADADAMMREAAGGLVARPEGFLISITTQSDKQPAGVFKDKLEYARNVRDGKVEDKKFLPVIYEFPESMVEREAYLDPSNFYVTNPHLGLSDFGRNWIADELAKEKEKGPETRNVFLAKHLNIEIGLRLRSDAWAGGKYWLASADRTITLETILERCEVVTIGIDGGGLDDLLGLAVLGRCKNTRDWLLWNRAWCHSDLLEDRKDIAPRLLDFTKTTDGTWSDLVLCSDEDPTQSIREVADICVKIRDAGLLPEKGGIGVDRMGLPGILEELMSRGFDVDINNGTITGIPQGGHVNPAIQSVPIKLKDGTFWHAGQPMMAWCVGNAKVEMKTNARSITKQIAGSAKIDPLMATFDAVMLMSRNPEANGSGLDDYLKYLAEAAA